jgi:hypothetical protein
MLKSWFLGVILFCLFRGEKNDKTGVKDGKILLSKFQSKT